MPDLNLLAVLVAGIAAFIVSAAWYALLITAGNASSAPPEVWKLGLEGLRSLVLALVMAGLAARIGVGNALGGMALAVVLWVGFPAVLWAGAMLWEGTPLKLALLHGGDWLIKMLLIGAIVGAWK